MKAIEVTGRIDEERQLHLDDRLPIDGPSQVRVIILVSDEADIEEQEWLVAGTTNPTLSFLHKSDQDIYTPTDGKPFVDQG
jgi:hypothetical protein